MIAADVVQDFLAPSLIFVCGAIIGYLCAVWFAYGKRR